MKFTVVFACLVATVLSQMHWGMQVKQYLTALLAENPGITVEECIASCDENFDHEEGSSGETMTDHACGHQCQMMIDGTMPTSEGGMMGGGMMGGGMMGGGMMGGGMMGGGMMGGGMMGGDHEQTPQVVETTPKAEEMPPTEPAPNEVL